MLRSRPWLLTRTKRNDDVAVRRVPAPHPSLVLNQQVVGQKLNVPRSVLDLVPLANRSRAELPVAGGPSAHVLERKEIRCELLSGGDCRRPAALTDTVHDEAETYDTRAMHEPGPARLRPPRVLENLAHRPPEILKHAEDRLDVRASVAVPEAIKHPLIEAV